jgi:hypothetical protein
MMLLALVALWLWTGWLCYRAGWERGNRNGVEVQRWWNLRKEREKAFGTKGLKGVRKL